MKNINEERIYQAGMGIVLQILASKFFICPNQKSVSHVPGQEGKRYVFNNKSMLDYFLQDCFVLN